MRVGYACLNLDVFESNFKTLRLSSLSDERLLVLIEHNLSALEAIVDYNIKHKIELFRITSSLIPFGSLHVNQIDWKDVFKDKLLIIKSKIVSSGMRISVHPGQFTVLNSLDENVVLSSILELEYHTDILESLGGTQESKMILHVGGVYGDKDLAIARFIDVYQNRLSERIKRHLVIENDDRLFTLLDVLNISGVINIPVIYDNLHHEINPSLEDLSKDEIMARVFGTWGVLDGKPKVHYSEQDSRKRPGAHSYTIDLNHFIKEVSNYDMDVMLEVKDKNRSALKANIYLKDDQKELEKEWARYKYAVMAKSQAHYNDLRKLFSVKPVDVLSFYNSVDEAMKMDDRVMQNVNALQHVWGYFKKVVDEKTKLKYMSLIDDYTHELIDLKKVKRFLFKLSVEHEVIYLLDSYYFDS